MCPDPRVILHASGARVSAFWLSHPARNAPTVWFSAPWSATVLATQDPAGSSCLLQMCRCAAAYAMDWMGLSPSSALRLHAKFLVTWQLWCWAHWPCLPDHGFVVPEDDPHSFAAYDDSLLACMARIAYSVPHFYSLVRRLVFVRWQNAANLPPGYTCVRISAAKRADVGLSPGIWSHAKPSRFMVIS